MSKGKRLDPKKGKDVGSTAGYDNRIFERYFRVNFFDCKVDSMLGRADVRRMIVDEITVSS